MDFRKKIYYIITLIIISACQEANIIPWYPPVPKPIERDSVWADYFPNTPGTEWLYQIKIKSLPDSIIDAGTIRVKIEKRVLINDSISASLWVFDKNGNKYKKYAAIIDDSVFFFSDINNLKDKTNIFKSYVLPLNKFREWDFRVLNQNFGRDQASGGGNYIEPVTVPAGKFDSVYEIERITDANDRKAHEWINFVPGTGMVRSESLDNSSNLTTIWELLSFHIQK